MSEIPEIADLSIPNLDGMVEEDLHDVADILEAAARYARSKARALVARAEGRLEAARLLERRCERAYNELPRWARW
jgi:hypothetical protein